MRGIQDNPDAVRFCDRFLEVAEEFGTVKWGLSEDFAETFRCEEQLCFENCQRIASRIPDLRYFEGLVSCGEVVSDHAWLVDEVGEVLDPTLALRAGLAETAEGYMGVEIPSDYTDRLFRENLRMDTRIEQAFADGLW